MTALELLLKAAEVRRLAHSDYCEYTRSIRGIFPSRAQAEKEATLRRICALAERSVLDAAEILRADMAADALRHE